MHLLVLMGVCGCGKSSVGIALAQELGWEFIEGDELHSKANITKMASGQALNDEDRRGWLLALAGKMRQAAHNGQSLVLTCSSLKRSYRELLRHECGAEAALRFIFLSGDEALFANRLAERRGHYMPASLLHSQLAALEPPAVDEEALTLDAALVVDANVQEICRVLELGSHSQKGKHVHGQIIPA